MSSPVVKYARKSVRDARPSRQAADSAGPEFGARHGAPQPLFLAGHETEDQLSGEVPSHQPFGVREIPLAAFRRLVGMRLRQLQFPLPLPRLPDRLPVLCGRFHHYFLHILPCQPLRQHRQFRRPAENFRRSNRNSPISAASVITTAGIFLHVCARNFV